MEPRSWQPASSSAGARYATDGFTSSVSTAAAPPPAASLQLTGSVGHGGLNKTQDVLTVQRRLRELGYPVPLTGKLCAKTQAVLKLFEAIVCGKETTREACGKLDRGGNMARALASPNAPRWQEIPQGGPGWKNVDADFHDYATDITVKVLSEAGASYKAAFLDAHPNRSLIESNDGSRAAGGDTEDHKSHEAGLDLDLRLPTKGGARATVHSSNYDREAARAIVVAFASNPRVERVLIGDQKLLDELRRSGASWASKVQDGGKIHDNHIHVDVAPPSVE